MSTLYTCRDDSPLGPMVLVADAGAIRMLEFHDRRHVDFATARLAGMGTMVETATPLLDEARRQMAAYFAGRRRAFDLPLAPTGTPFQLRVWEELQRIPFGQTISYGELARRVGDPRAVRAVAQANGRNFLAVVIPCHRVIGADGTLTGYGGGLQRKRWLLDLESRVAGTADAAELPFAAALA